ncbi:MAG TPA: LTA synthase family protein, partial [Vulgatibacter sp.]
SRLVLSTLGAMLLAVPLIRRWPGRRQIAVILVSDLVLTAFTYGDLLHYRAFGALSSVAQLGVVAQLADVWEGVLGLVEARDLLLFADVAALAFALAFPRPDRWPALGPKSLVGTAVVGASVIALTAWDSPRFSTSWKGKSFLAGDIGLLGYHVVDVLDVVKKARERRDHVPSEEIVSSAAEALRRAGTEGEASASFGAATGHNVILLQVESFQGFAAGLEIGGQKVTPRFDGVAVESMVFDRFFHVASIGRTSDAQFAANCSLLPSTSKPVAVGYLENEYRCLPALLAEAGYATAAFQPLEPDIWNASAMDRKMGYQRSFSSKDFVAEERIGMGHSDRSLLRQVAQKLEALPEPFLASVLTISSHTPFDWPGIPKELDLGALEGTRVGHFLHAIRYTDEALGEFVDALRATGLLERSVLVVYGDHDAWTRKNSNLRDLLAIDPEDEGGWLEEERRVALAIRLPRGEGAGRYATVGSQLDLAPTVLALLGRSRDEAYFQGRDLLGPAPAAPIAAMPDGSAIGTDLVHLSAQRTLGEARCYSAGKAVPVERCAALAKRAGEQAALAQDVLDGDLIPLIARRRLVADVVH